MDSSYFCSPRILDGGMGQALLQKGIASTGTLWSTNALLEPQQHDIIRQTHLEYIEAGAEVIITNNFTARKQRMTENGIAHCFAEANVTAGRLARHAADSAHQPVFVAGSLPPQDQTYQPTSLDEITHSQYVLAQAKLLLPFVDLFYLDVMSSVQEVYWVLQAIEPLALPVLIGAHVRDTGLLPSGESLLQVAEVARECVHPNKLLGIIAACVSPEVAFQAAPTLRQSGVPYGFKINGFEKIPPNWRLQSGDQSPTHTLGSRKDITPARFDTVMTQLCAQGATILGGCCEIMPAHIATLAHLKRSEP